MADQFGRPDGFMREYHCASNEGDGSMILFYLKNGMHCTPFLSKEEQFKRKVEKWLVECVENAKLKFDGRQIVITTVPSHEAGKLHEFLIEIVTMMIDNNPDLGIEYEPLLKRTHTIKSRSHNKQLHRQSISVDCPGGVAKETMNSGKVVLILDDCFTTGSTIKACKEKILETGTTEVEMLAIEKISEINE